MKILAASDIHGDTRISERLARKAEAEKVDFVILCGDLTFFERSLEGILGPFVKKGLKVFFVPGNHETTSTAEKLSSAYAPNAMNIHGKTVVLNDEVGLFGWYTQDFVDVKKKIMVTHIPPTDTLISMVNGACMGSPSVRDAVNKFQPDLLLCGHVHETFGVQDTIGRTRIINTGPEGIILEI